MFVYSLYICIARLPIFHCYLSNTHNTARNREEGNGKSVFGTLTISDVISISSINSSKPFHEYL